MKGKLWISVALVGVTLMVCAASPDKKNSPPGGVPAEQWVAVTDSMGFIISKPRPVRYEKVETNIVTQPGGGMSAVEMGVPTVFAADAILMAKVAGHWCRLDLTTRPARAEFLK